MAVFPTNQVVGTTVEMGDVTYRWNGDAWQVDITGDITPGHVHAGGDITSGTVAISKGGTGQSTAQTAINSLTGVNSASFGQVLSKASGGNAEWETIDTVTVSGLGDTTIMTPTDAHIIVYDDTTDKWENQVMTGDVTMDKDGLMTIQAGSVENSMLDNNSIAVTAGNGLTGGGTPVLGGSVSLAVGVDGSSIEIDSDALRVKASGITNTMLAGSIASTKIAELNNFSTSDLSQGTNLYFTNTNARGAIDATTSGDGSLTYTQGTGVFAYIGPSATQHRAHFSASGSDGLNYSAGNFTLDQSIETSATPTFSGLTITGNLTTNGTTTTVNATQIDVQDPIMRLASNNAADSRDIGLVGLYNDGAAKHTALFRDASDGKWKLITASTQTDISTANEITVSSGSVGTLVANLEGDVTGDLTGDVTGTVSSIANHDTDDLSQGSTNKYHTTGGVRESVSSTTSGDGSLNYTQGTGVFAYVGPSAAEHRAHFSGTAPVVYTSSTGVISLSADTDDITEAGNKYYTDAKVRLNRLDQMTAPTADVSFNSKKITNLATGTANTDAITKAQLDGHNHSGVYSPIAHTHGVDDLTDVDTTTAAPTDGQTLLWDNTNSIWEPGTISEGGNWTTTPEDASLDGNVALKKQTSAPSATADYAKIYSKDVVGDIAAEVLFHFDANVLDSSENSRNGTNTGVSFTTSGVTGFSGGDAGVFDGSAETIGGDDYIEFDDPGIGTSDFTVEWWWRRDLNSGQNGDCPVSINTGSTVTEGGFAIYTASATTLYIIYYNEGWTSYAATLPSNSADTWYHVRYVRSGTSHYLYWNGTKIETWTHTAYSIGTSSLSWNLGRFFDGSHDTHNDLSLYNFKGQMDEFTITKTALSIGATYTVPSSPYLGRPSRTELYSQNSLGFSTQLSGISVLDSDGTVVFNESGADVNFRIEGDTDINLFVVDASTNNVGIGVAAPQNKLHVQGTIQGNAIVTGDSEDIIFHTNGTAEFNRNAEDINLQVQGNSDTHLLWIDGGTDRVGIGQSAPAQKLDIDGTVKSTAAIIGTSSDILLNADGSAVFNEQGEDVDFRVEGDADQNLLFVDASTDRIGMGTSTPTDRLQIQGTMRSNAIVTGDTGEIILHTNGTAEFNRNSADINFQVQGNNDTHLLWIDGGTDRVGIGQSAPAQKLDVDGTIKSTAAIFGTSSDIVLNADGSAVFNEQGEDVDFRVEGDVDPNLLYVNAGTDRIGIGQSNPTDKLHVQGTIRGDALVGGADVDFILHTNGTAQFNLQAEAIDFQVQGDSDTHLLFVDGSENRVGIGVTAPTTKLDVAGTVKSTALLIDPAGSSSDFDAIKIGVDQEVQASIKFYDNDLESTEHYKVTYGAGATNAGVLKFHSDSTDNVLQMNEEGVIGVNQDAAAATGGLWAEGGGKLVIRSSGPNSVTTTMPLTTGTVQTGCALRLEASYAPHANVLDFGVNSNTPHQTWIQATNRAALGSNFLLALNPNGGNISINRPDNSYPLHVGNSTANGNGAYCTAGGVWTDTSNRESKDNITPLSEADATAAIMALEPQTYNYKDTTETHVGFIAEDVPDLVASEGRKGLSPMDIVAALTKVVQRQEIQIKKLMNQYNNN